MLGCFPFARHYSGNLGWFLFLQVLRCFNSLGLLLRAYAYAFSTRWLINQSGCPIRRPPDQSLCISSPRLIADFHVLLRLQLPRHPPYALLCLTLLLEHKDLAIRAQSNVIGSRLMFQSRFPPDMRAWAHTHQARYITRLAWLGTSYNAPTWRYKGIISYLRLLENPIIKQRYYCCIRVFTSNTDGSVTIQVCIKPINKALIENSGNTTSVYFLWQ